VALTRAPGNLGENQNTSLETPFTLGPDSEQGTVDSDKKVYAGPFFESDETTISDSESASNSNLPLSNQ